MSLGLNKLCVVVWQRCDAKYEWYIAYVKEIKQNGYVVDHLHRVANGCNIKWKYPSSEDIQIAEHDQIVNCDVLGGWDFTPDARKRLFIVTNIKIIEKAFKKHVKS